MRYWLISICCAVLLLFGTFAFGQEDASSSQQDKSTDNARAAEESSSKDTRVDLSPPSNDQKSHPMSSTKIDDENDTDSDVQEMHPWDPHKAAKDVEVGDYYFKRKNYKAAIARYQDALIYKPNDALAQYRLAEALDKAGHSGDAVEHYQEYLKILPHGPNADDAQKALVKLNAEQAKPSVAK
ncbi:MAG TPA: tetratricopeptide repeat protein [Terriglobales bacterium]|nr:tetratricopeptide repeat protein [Terriglobales bacterium]